jgi:hypothetical protein
MPLAFESLSHGTIAFGFFNIESKYCRIARAYLKALFLRTQETTTKISDHSGSLDTFGLAWT